ncbi:sperm-associated antigen 5 [Leuresthes tenuis]|uniref:sperm-associated antigen 5 n=1 Tax=Leuresthes tenuis TaxID=355514 RepID=UPI003B50FEEC
MSSRKSSSSGESLPHSRYGERTPLRSLDNEVQRLSAHSSRLKPKPQFDTDAVKMTMGGIPFCDTKAPVHSPSFSKVIQTSPPPTDTTQTPYGLGDVTFKSFLCAGGEVEISESSVCAEERIFLPEDTTSCNSGAEDTFISHSVMEQSGCDHIEHPYHKPDVKEPYSVDIHAPSLCEMPNPASFGEVDDKETTQILHSDCGGEKQITLRSFVCDSGEVEISDATRMQDETILLPMADLRDPSQDNNTNLTDCSDDHAQLCQMQNADHQNGIVPVNATFFVSPNGVENGSETPANGLTDVTFKSLNCTGGEIEILEGSKLADETVPLPFCHTVSSSESLNYCMDPSVLAEDHDLQNSNDHIDHPYCNIENDFSPTCDLSMTQDPLPCCTEAVGAEQKSVIVPNCLEATEEHVASHSVIPAGGEAEKTDDTQMSEMTSPPSQDQGVNCQTLVENVSTSFTQDRVQGDYEQPDDHLENGEVVADNELPVKCASSPSNTYLKIMDEETAKCHMHAMPENTIRPEDSALPGVACTADVSNGSHLVASTESSTHIGVQQNQDDYVSQVFPSSGPPESSEAKDSALGSSSEKPPAEDHQDVLKFLAECPSVASALQLGILSPVVKRASLSLLKGHGELIQDQFLTYDFALENDKSLVAPVNVDPVGLWAEHMESPMPRPLFNSTALLNKQQPASVTEQDNDSGKKLCEVPQPEIEKPDMDNPLLPEGQLQQQFQQMVEYFILASRKMGASVFPASAPPPAASMAPSQRATPVESYSVCVGTSPVKLIDHSLNTSGVFESKREFSVVDSCTVTDPLLWNLPPGSLECLHRTELEQRLRSSMIMVEALVQQLASARAQGCASAGPAPSDLREKLVQTDHTELSQTTMYRDLYLEALSRISKLEHDGSSLKNLMQCMQDMRATLESLSGDTDAALSNMRAMGDAVKEDHQSLVSHYGHMKSLLEKSKETQTKMKQKVKEVLNQRNDMRNQMEGALTAKEAAFSAMEQLRTHCAAEISTLEKSVGSQQELLTALNQTHPEQVGLNKACDETLSSASELLSQTMDDHYSLMNELSAVRGLLQRAAPMLLMLNEKAATALSERDEHISERDRAIEEREQIEEELNETHSNLQTARQQIGDLNLQVTILTSEMGVLRQKLTEKEEETGQLERKATELSATVSSTLASYTFLEQALAAETTKLQQSWKDIQQANERANQLEASLGEAEQRAWELSQTLAQSEEQLSQLQNLSQSQRLQIQQLQDACAQLNGVQEMNEFLQMENELAREQMTESERMLSTNLQGLRERNIQCEDLKAEVCKLQLENKNLREELETTRSTADATQLELKEKMAQAVTEITLLHHTLRGLANELQAALDVQKQDQQKDKESQLFHNVEGHQPSSSFVDSIKMALTAEEKEDGQKDTPGRSDASEPQRETLFSETSAFTRIAALTPKQNMDTVAVEEEEEEDEQSSVTELLSGLGSTVTELISTLKTVQQRKDAQLQELHSTICGLQVAQQAASSRHQAEVSELKHQLSRLNNVVERGNRALLQCTQDEKTLTKLMADVQEAQEILNKHKTDNSELKKDVTELRRALQQANVESQFLREELRKAGGQSANPVHYLEEKIQLLKEVERLKSSLQEAEQARVKLLERAKRHQIIHQTNQQKSENELQILNHMINKVRETLLALPEVVKHCEQLQQLVEYIG